MNAFVRLRQTNRLEAARVAAGLLDNPDRAIRRGAIRAISILQAQTEVAETLAQHLRTNQDRDVRLGCAINLMTVQSPFARAAFVDALRDPEGKVVQVACVEVGHRGGAGVKEALLAVLNHPSWRVRLEACKALIIAKAADAKVVAALEQMSREPEAAVYDAEDEEFERREKELGAEGALGPTWGKLDRILEQARQVAASNR